MSKILEHSNFNTYPHYVYATAFLVNGKLADYKIQNSEKCWGLRTFRGMPWENEVWQHGFIDKDWNLTCEYNKILVNNEDEHDKAFETLENWLFDNFEIYEKTGLNFIYKKVQNKLIEDKIDIQSIEELNDTCYCMMKTDSDLEYYHNITITKLNELIKAVKQLDNKN